MFGLEKKAIIFSFVCVFHINGFFFGEFVFAFLGSFFPLVVGFLKVKTKKIQKNKKKKQKNKIKIKL